MYKRHLYGRLSTSPHHHIPLNTTRNKSISVNTPEVRHTKMSTIAKTLFTQYNTLDHQNYKLVRLRARLKLLT